MIQYMNDLPLYWSNPDILLADAKVIEARQTDIGWELRLENAPFYPGGGGQPADRGSICGTTLLGIRKEDGKIFHKLESSGIFTIGDAVQCSVDSDFRRDSMQQHTGQHLLSAALYSEGLDTVSVHLGQEHVGIEVEGAEGVIVPEETVRQVLDRCKLWISENRKVISRYLKPEELDNLNLRRPAAGKSDLVRVVEIEGLDHVGCGGVHLKDTASIGMILYLGSEKIRGRVRLKWLIGGRAVKHAEKLSRQMRQIQKLLSSGPGEIPEKVESLITENQMLNKRVKNLEEKTGRMLAESWLADSEEDQLIVETIQTADGGRECIEAAAGKLISAGAAGCFLLNNNSWIFFAKGRDASFFNDFRTEVLTPFKVKGGGKPPLWRGRIEGETKEILVAVRAWFAIFHHEGA